MRKKWLIGTLIFLTTVAGFFVWFSVDQAINDPSASVWMIPLICASIFIISYFLSAILIEEPRLMSFLIIVSLFPGLIFATDYRHILSVGVGFLLLRLASSAIARELEAGVRINPYRIFRAGSFLTIFAISLIIAAQYFFEVRDFEVGRQIPKLPTQEISNLVVPKIIALINPEFRNMKNENLTVDNFILKNQKKSINESATTMSKEEVDMIIAAQSEVSQELVLAQGRKELSAMTEIPLTGDEKITDVLAQKVDKSIADFVTPMATKSTDFPALPMSMAGILFLSVFSLGSLFSIVWISLAGMIFSALVALGAASIKKVSREVEVLE